MRCPACDKPNDPEAAFCSKCGAKLPKARRAAQEIEVEIDDEEPARRPGRRAADEDEVKPRARRAVADEDDEEDEPGAIGSIIPYRNVTALSAYYLGIFTLIPIAGCILIAVYAATAGGPEAMAFLGITAPLGLLLGPIALLLGILGIRKASANPSAKGTGHGVVGTVLGLIGTILSLAALVYFFSNLEHNRRVLREWWKVVQGP